MYFKIFLFYDSLAVMDKIAAYFAFWKTSIFLIENTFLKKRKKSIFSYF